MHRNIPFLLDTQIFLSLAAGYKHHVLLEITCSYPQLRGIFIRYPRYSLIIQGPDQQKYILIFCFIHHTIKRLRIQEFLCSVEKVQNRQMSTKTGMTATKKKK